MSKDLTLWSDDPTKVDLLAFNAVADTVTEALLDEKLDPVAIGLSGRWGSGKTTVLQLVDVALAAKNTEESKVLVVSTQPWRYDPTTGVKESLIAEVLAVLAEEIKEEEGAQGKAKKLLGRLVKRVDWAKAIRLTTKAAVALQVPSFDELTELIKDNPDDDEKVRGLEAFRDEFRELMASNELKHVQRVVVLVDDLDRCLPETVVETLEAIRLFLAVPKMSFVLAADEERVSEAIRTRFPGQKMGDSEDKDAYPVEDPADLYLHKIVQTTVPVPSLSRFDTQAYIFLLLLMNRLEEQEFQQYIQQCSDLRINLKDLDELAVVEGVDVSDELAFAARLTPLLYEKLHGNPRRIKRFLNDLFVRQSIAKRRGIALEAAVVAKLMILEVLLKDDFKNVIDWFAKGELRSNMEALEQEASRPRDTATEEQNTDEGQAFPDALLRWAKLPPALGSIDLAPYFSLAASFSGKTLVSADLPERLRDIASNLLSDSKAEQRSVGDSDLLALSAGDVATLVRHLGRMGRDQPKDQRRAVGALLRIAHLRADAHEEAKNALIAIPADEVAMPTILLFSLPKDEVMRPVLAKWQGTSNPRTRSAINNLLNPRSN